MCSFANFTATGISSPDSLSQLLGQADLGLPPEATGRAVEEYLAVLDDAAFGAATEVVPKFVSPADPPARWTGAMADKHSSPTPPTT